MFRSTATLLLCALLIVSACDESAGQDPQAAPPPAEQTTDDRISPQHDILDPARPDPPLPVPAQLPYGLLEEDSDNAIVSRSLDPLCFLPTKDATAGDRLPISGCATGYKVSKDDYSVAEDTTRRVTYIDSKHPGVKSSISYKYLGDLQADYNFAVQVTAESPTGSGFTRLLVLSREDKTLKIIRVIRGGDRCSGGINEAAVNANGDLLYTINLTPRGMIDLSPLQKTAEMKSYESLENCPTCCYAVAEHKNNTIEAITFNSGLRQKLQGLPSATPPSQQDQTIQQCFNEIVAQYLVRDRTRLLMFELEGFAETFRDTCLIDWSQNPPPEK